MSNGQNIKIRDGWEKLEIIAGMLGKLLIPIVVVILPWFWSMYQTNLQKKQQEAKIEEKALDIFYKDISSNDPAQQSLSVGVLKMVKPDFAVKLTGFLSGLNDEQKLSLTNRIVADSSQSEAVRTEAYDIMKTVRKTKPGEQN